jgi:hypothetical protein
LVNPVAGARFVRNGVLEILMAAAGSQKNEVSGSVAANDMLVADSSEMPGSGTT